MATLNPDQLETDLGRQLRPVYLVSGDEPLLVIECANRIRECARRQGVGERTVLHVDTEKGYDFGQLHAAGSGMSLFGDRTLIELRFAKAPGSEGSKAIADYCANANSDAVLLVTTPKLDKKAGELGGSVSGAGGAHVQVWPVERDRLPAWIRARLARHGLRATDDAVALLTDRIEGNLLAAQQEIDRLALLHGGQAEPVDAAQLAAVVADNARFDTFAPIDVALAGDAARALRMLDALQQAGEEPVPILWSLSRDVRWLLQASEIVASGAGEQAALARCGAWSMRQKALAPALRRLRVTALRALLADCAKAEKVNKGQAPGSSWDALATLLARLAGSRPAPGTGREIV